MTFGGFDNTNLWLLTCQQLYQQEVLMIEYINTRIGSHCSSSENVLKIIWDAAIISLSISIMTFAKDLLGDSFRRRTFSRFNAFFDERKRKVQIDCPRRESRRESGRQGPDATTSEGRLEEEVFWLLWLHILAPRSPSSSESVREGGASTFSFSVRGQEKLSGLHAILDAVGVSEAQVRASALKRMWRVHDYVCVSMHADICAHARMRTQPHIRTYTQIH